MKYTFIKELQKAVNAKSVVLINCKKINWQKKKSIMRKQLNELVLKSLKPKQFELKSENKSFPG